MKIADRIRTYSEITPQHLPVEGLIVYFDGRYLGQHNEADGSLGRNWLRTWGNLANKGSNINFYGAVTAYAYRVQNGIYTSNYAPSELSLCVGKLVQTSDEDFRGFSTFHVVKGINPPLKFLRTYFRLPDGSSRDNDSLVHDIKIEKDASTNKTKIICYDYASGEACSECVLNDPTGTFIYEASQTPNGTFEHRIISSDMEIVQDKKTFAGLRPLHGFMLLPQNVAPDAGNATYHAIICYNRKLSSHETDQVIRFLKRTFMNG